MVPENEFRFDKMFASLKEALAKMDREIPFKDKPLSPFSDCESFDDIEFELSDYDYYLAWSYSTKRGTLKCESSEGELVLSASDDGSVYACCTIWAEEYDDSFAAVLESAGWQPDHSTYEAGLRSVALDYYVEEDYPTHAPMHWRRR